MELIYAIIVLGAIQTVLSTPAFYNNELKNSYSNSKNNYKLFPESTAYKKSWYADSKQTIPVKSNEHANEISKFPFNLNSLYNNNQEQQWKKEYNIIEKKDANKLDVFEDEYEDDSSSTEDYENITITLSEEDLADRIDDALMCSLLGRCFEDQQ